MNCMSAIKEQKGHRDWKYVQIISGNDAPLKSNLEMVRILKIYNGSHDVELSRGEAYRYKHSVSTRDAKTQVRSIFTNNSS